MGDLVNKIFITIIGKVLCAAGRKEFTTKVTFCKKITKYMNLEDTHNYGKKRRVTIAVFKLSLLLNL
jgi:hypothetical protein